MIKRIFKRIFVFAAIACLLFACVPSVAFADVVEFQEAAKMGATIVDLYGMANNTSLAYDVASNGSALTVIENLYSEYSSSASDPYTLAAIGAAAAAAGTIAVVYDAITGQGYIQLYQEQYISSLDGFWDYTLDDLGFLKDEDGNYIWESVNDVVSPVPVFTSVNYVALPVVNLSSSDSSLYSSSLKVCRTSYNPNPSSKTTYGLAANMSDVYAFLYSSDNVVYNACIFSTNSSYTRDHSKYVYYYTNGNGYSSNVLGGSVFNSNGLYYVYGGIAGDPYRTTETFIPVYPSLSAGLTVASSQGPGSSVSIEPTVYIGDPLASPAVITIPDPANPLYNPSPITIPTNIPWDPLWGDPLPDGVSEPVPGIPYPVTDPATLNNAVPDIWASIVAGDVQVSEPNPEPDPDPDPDPEPGPGPSEVFTPLLPVTLPSFNFSFSGIWHYVREWVSSLGAWFTTLFLIWSKLPYAMVVPVYATAVVVIVLGVYKRFFM